MKAVHKVVDLLLYSSVWIALCAAAQVQLSYVLTGSYVRLDHYSIFIFFSTIALYSVHRIVGMDKVKAFEHEGRFAVIRKYASHIRIYGVIGAIGSAIAFLMLPWQTWVALIIPIAISVGYVVPMPSATKRLRDYPLVKIFLLAIAWSMLTTIVPLLYSGYALSADLILIFTERALFLIAITIPFDIRDLQVDASASLPTIPASLGIARSKVVAVLLQCISACLVLLLIYRGTYESSYTMAYAVLFALTVYAIAASLPDRHDYYYSGFVDGLMIVGFVAFVIIQPTN